MDSNIGFRLSAEANTYNSALRIIKSKGYKIFLYPDQSDDLYGTYWAIKENRDFIAEDPLRLLGIITIWETNGDNWSGPNHENIRDKIASNAFPDSVADIEKLSEEDFEVLVKDYTIFLNRIFPKQVLPVNPTRQTFFDVISNFYKWDLEQFYEWEE
ncbi:hypothetical protein [Flavobacterium cerinum]|uniref:DUF4303 domain-containing protein n=1 Tax=Flavobacterium cerinum TaxID=2502784 RepID=A0ABY5ITR9_9FLAO|nr:hypothetical protein [Flavobacterium cerinum]UUC45138.1 hypothetical protein NOX80_16125 [Flavobacterium cerinum]